MNTPAVKPAPAPGVICDGEVYRLREVCRRLGWKEHALRKAREAGLRMIIFGREKYVLGADILGFFKNLAEQPAVGDGGEGGGDEK
jgi:hypothetical protein